MFMRAGMIESCVMKLVELVHLHLRTLSPGEDLLEEAFDFLLLDRDAIDRAECTGCLSGPAGIVLGKTDVASNVACVFIFCVC